jgi:hypothetical protein
LEEKFFVMIDSKLAEMIHAHPLIIVGSCDRALVPSTGRGFGARIGSDGKTMEVLVARLPAPQTLANFEQTKRIAVTFTQPEDFVSYQLKGHVISCVAPDDKDKQLATTYCETIARRLNAVGAPANVAGLIFLGSDVMRVSFDVIEAFVQTPGKNAGTRL